MSTIAIIPARMSSTRFPGKPMVDLHGIPMIGHVYYRTKMAKHVDVTYVATCDLEIFEYIRGIGGNAIMTADTHTNAITRTAEALISCEKSESVKYDYVAMIQGDEPLVKPDNIDKAINVLQLDASLNVVNLMSVIDTDIEFEDNNNVKVVVDLKGNALYFSREPIPSHWQTSTNLKRLKQLGLIFFTRKSLLWFNQLERTPLEVIESVDMMRVLENQDRVRMVEVEGENIGVDTQSDYDMAFDLLKSDDFLPLYQPNTYGTI